MGKPYISVLERNMSNPEYRRQLEEQQALKRVHPEALLAGAGSSIRAGLRGTKKPESQVQQVKIGENITDDLHPVWKNVAAGPSQKDLLDALRKREKQNNFYQMMEAWDDAVKESGKRMLREAAAQPMFPSKENNSYKKGGVVSASKRADGCCQRGKTRGKMV